MKQIELTDSLPLEQILQQAKQEDVVLTRERCTRSTSGIEDAPMAESLRMLEPAFTG